MCDLPLPMTDIAACLRSDFAVTQRAIHDIQVCCMHVTVVCMDLYRRMCIYKGWSMVVYIHGVWMSKHTRDLDAYFFRRNACGETAVHCR